MSEELFVSAGEVGALKRLAEDAEGMVRRSGKMEGSEEGLPVPGDAVVVAAVVRASTCNGTRQPNLLPSS